MTGDFINMLGLYGSGATGRKFEKALSADEISCALKSARRYGCLFVAYVGAKNSFEGVLPDELDSTLAEKTKEQRLRYAAKQMRATEIFNSLDEAEIPWAILKGWSVGRYYADPLTRASNDIDLLVYPDDEEKALEIFRQMGFNTEYNRTEGSHHTELTKPEYGLVELHIDIAEPEVLDVWCGGGERFRLSGPFVKASNGVGEFYALCPEDALYSVAYHTFKDFITGVPSIKGAIDLALSVRACPKESLIGFWENMSRKKLDRVVCAILDGAVKYCTFTREELDIPDWYDGKMTDVYFDDIENSAKYPREMPLDAIRALADKHIKENGGEKTISATYSKLGLLFPPCDVMERRYKYLKKAPFLLPFAWACRIFSYLFLRSKDKRKSDAESGEAQKEASKRRIDLYRRFGMMD